MPARQRRLVGAITALLLVVGLLVTAVVGAWMLRPAPSTEEGADPVFTSPLPSEDTTDEPSPADPDEAPEQRTASIVMSGDLLWHDTVWFSAAEDHALTGVGDRFDFDPMFAAMKPMVVAADVALCHEEVPFAAPGEPLSSYPVFAAPHQVAAWIGSMGWDACTTASNHSMDAGRASYAGHRHHRPGCEGRGRGRDVRPERLRPALGPGVDGLAAGRRRRPARPGAAGARSGRRHRDRALPLGHGVRPPPERRPGRDRRAADRVSRHRRRAGRARARRATDHEGERQVDRLRDGQHGRPERARPVRGLRGASAWS